MYPFSYTGLRLVHDEKVRNALERARVNAEFRAARDRKRSAEQRRPVFHVFQRQNHAQSAQGKSLLRRHSRISSAWNAPRADR